MLFQNFRPVINDYLPMFLDEIRRKNGTLYPPRTLYTMPTITQILELNLKCDIMNDSEFTRARKYFDKNLKKLTANGNQPLKRRAEIVSEEMVSELYRTGILGDSGPTIPLRTVYFILRKFFALRSR